MRYNELARNLRRNQTSAEGFLWDVLRNRRFDHFKFLRQHNIFINDGFRKRVFIADFYNAESKLVVEVDGSIHEFTKEKDNIRDKLMRERGYSICRIQNEEVDRDLFQVLTKIKIATLQASPLCERSEGERGQG